jgi:hypothetical protein
MVSWLDASVPNKRRTALTAARVLHQPLPRDPRLDASLILFILPLSFSKGKKVSILL